MCFSKTQMQLKAVKSERAKNVFYHTCQTNPNKNIRQTNTKRNKTKSIKPLLSGICNSTGVFRKICNLLFVYHFPLNKTICSTDSGFYCASDSAQNVPVQAAGRHPNSQLLAVVGSL